MDTIEAYSVTLTGQGDIFAFFVDKEVFEWITGGKESGRNNQSSWLDQDIPFSAKERIEVINGVDEIEVTCGSLDNDRALHAMSATLILNGKETSKMDSVNELFNFAHKNNIMIIDEYVGNIY
jgi:hypothetical protein